MLAQLAPYAPLWTEAKAHAVGLDLTGGLTIDLVSTCPTEDAAQQVRDTLQAMVTLSKNTMANLRPRIKDAPRPMSPIEVFLATAADPLLDKTTIERDGNVVHARSATDVRLADTVQTLLPTVQNTRQKAFDMRSTNNLKQIALALYNYHDANGHFPPAVLYGPDGKTPYSWRVAILPYIEQAALYDQYHFDEPWDSPHNKTLLAKIPDLYRYPNAKGDPTAASYYVLNGPGTIFDDKDGTKVAEIRDGTAFTLLVVEAQRDIPWTKPEDIPYAPNKPLPELGGFNPEGFHAAMADGSVRFWEGIDAKTLRAMISKAGGELVEFPPRTR